MKQKAKTLTKRDIAIKVSDLKSQPIYVTSEWVETTFQAIRELLMTDEQDLRIEIRDFGVFEVKVTRPKPKARNPKTGETFFIPFRRKTHFKPSKLIRDFLQKPLSIDEIKDLSN